MKDSSYSDQIKYLVDRISYLEKENLQRELHIKILAEDVESICNTINLIIDELNDD